MGCFYYSTLLGCFYLIQRSIGLLLIQRSVGWLVSNTNEYKAITAAQAAAQAEFNSTALAAALAVALNSIHSNLQLRLNFEAGPARAPLPHHAAKKEKKAFTLS